MATTVAAAEMPTAKIAAVCRILCLDADGDNARGGNYDGRQEVSAVELADVAEQQAALRAERRRHAKRLALEAYDDDEADAVRHAVPRSAACNRPAPDRTRPSWVGLGRAGSD